MLKKLTLTAGILVAVGALMVSAQDATPEITAEATLEPGPDEIVIPLPGIMPEGVEYDAERGVFLIGSINGGTIYSVEEDGTTGPFLVSGNLTSSIGIHIDHANGRLLAAATENNRTSANLGVYDLETGEELAYVDLDPVAPASQSYFANDVTSDADGNIYVTDSAVSLIYKVDADYNVSVFLDDPIFDGQFALNGIDYHPNGYLIATKADGLVKIPLDDPTAFTEIAIDTPIGGTDGLVVVDENTLFTVSGQPRQILRLHSDDDFATASVTGMVPTAPDSATTVTVRGGEAYYTDARFQVQNAEEYYIRRANFDAAAG